MAAAASSAQHRLRAFLESRGGSLHPRAEGLDTYRQSSRRHTYTMDGDDQLANINTGVTELIEENLQLKHRVKALREERNAEQ